MTRAQRLATWNKYAQSGLSLDDVIDRAMAEAEQQGKQQARQWHGLDEAEQLKVRQLGKD